MRPRQRPDQRLVGPRLCRRPGDRRRWARQSPRSRAVVRLGCPVRSHRQAAYPPLRSLVKVRGNSKQPSLHAKASNGCTPWVNQSRRQTPT
jgi:hypothetical protein